MVYINKIEVDYFHLISGQDFPVKKHYCIKSFFEMNNGLSYMSYSSLPYNNWSNKGMDRILFEWDIDGIVVQQNQMGIIRNFPEKIKPYGGSQWWSLHKECVDYLLEVCNDGNYIYDFYKKCLIPDEMLFQTILMNSEYKNRIINDNLRYIDFYSGPEFPKILRIEDYDKLISENRFLFARKFDDYVDYKLRDMINNFIK